MTGRRLYDALTDSWARRGTFPRERGQWLKETPPAWAFLSSAERDTLNEAARRLTPKPKAKT